MTTTTEPPRTSTALPQPTPATPVPTHEQQLAALSDEVSRQVRALHSLKARMARGQSEVERAMHVVLFVLADAGPLRVSALAERLGTDPSTTSRQTGELVKRDLLRKLPDPDDRRASLLAVTDAGHDVVATMKQRRHEQLAAAVDGFDARELTVFTSLLARFVDGLEGAHPECLRPTSTPAAQENA
ncbi:MarR family winged helix-turn-helix transcriptional regulator [Kineococcus sp. GCM10028916]|uniref:MarR family winged helix-turn-helix transcriptional regulator n=1 Tax=Kineococcus sp. GCM10028916 TaxID=3273394 RepID=UPI0036341138